MISQISLGCLLVGAETLACFGSWVISSFWVGSCDPPVAVEALSCVHNPANPRIAALRLPSPLSPCDLPVWTFLGFLQCLIVLALFTF